MDDHSLILAKRTGILMLDQVAAQIPELAIAWGICKAMYGIGLELRRDRAIEWVEMIRDNPSVFTKELLNDEEFQDGFVYMLEQYIRERNENKRLITREIFIGFAQSSCLNKFPLEKFVHILSQLSEDDLYTLKQADLARGSTYSSPDQADKNYQIFGNTIRNLENIHSLINAGILQDLTGNRLGPIFAPYIRISDFGYQFVAYIFKD